jgi:hypothetical protein
MFEHGYPAPSSPYDVEARRQSPSSSSMEDATPSAWNDWQRDEGWIETPRRAQGLGSLKVLGMDCEMVRVWSPDTLDSELIWQLPGSAQQPKVPRSLA